MPYRSGRRHFPNPEDRRQWRQVVNARVKGQTDLTPTSQLPAEGLRTRMSAFLTGQEVPMVGERVTPVDYPFGFRGRRRKPMA